MWFSFYSIQICNQFLRNEIRVTVDRLHSSVPPASVTICPLSISSHLRQMYFTRIFRFHSTYRTMHFDFRDAKHRTVRSQIDKQSWCHNNRSCETLLTCIRSIFCRPYYSFVAVVGDVVVAGVVSTVVTWSMIRHTLGMRHKYSNSYLGLIIWFFLIWSIDLTPLTSDYIYSDPIFGINDDDLIISAHGDRVHKWLALLPCNWCCDEALTCAGVHWCSPANVSFWRLTIFRCSSIICARLWPKSNRRWIEISKD